MKSAKGLAGGLQNRFAIRFSVDGDLRFISHQDTLRLFRRAFARAGLPLRHSEGFNPHPKLSILMPRPVGVASEDEMLVAELADSGDAERITTRLGETLPEGMRINDVRPLFHGERMRLSIAEHAIKVDEEIRNDVRTKVTAFLNAERFPIERESSKKGRRYLDLRGFIAEAGWDSDDQTLWWKQEVSIDGTARIGEVLEAFGLTPRDHLHRVVRRRVDYHS